MLAGALTLAGCSAVSEPADRPSTIGSPAGAERGSTASPGQDAAVVDERRLVFDAAVEPVTRTKAPKGRAFGAALAAAGFDPGTVQFTDEETAVGLQASGIEFSVLVDGTCIVGQWGAELGYTSAMVPPLASGSCLVGAVSSLSAGE
jgi:hypothetical protein